MKNTLLLNFVYCRPVGHVVEALKHAKGYYDANRNLEVHVLLNKKSPVELADACYWIKKAYPIDALEVSAKGLKAKCLKNIPREWDYVVTDDRADAGSIFLAPELELRYFHKKVKDYFKARIWKGYINAWRWKKQPASFGYRKDAKITLEVPQKAIEFSKRYNHSGPKICILPAGSGGATSNPSIGLWCKIIGNLQKELKNPKFYITGITKSRNGQTHTKSFSRKELKKLFSLSDKVVNCYDIGLWNQLALIKKCDVLISPHTGFSFLAQCVGTPWLAISGRRWPEYLFNKVKFYSVLPDCRNFPCYAGMKLTCKARWAAKQRLVCMDDEHLSKKISEITQAAKLLMRKDFTYKKAVALHKKKIKKAGINKRALFAFDGAMD